MKSSKFEIRFLALLAIGLVVSAGAGCTLWNAGAWSGSDVLPGASKSGDDANTTAIRASRNSSQLSHQSQDTISLAVEFRHVPSSELGESMWRNIDETVFDARLRQAWLANGLRIGLLNKVEHSANDHSEEPQLDPINELFAGAKVLGGKADGREIISLRPSRRHELPLAPALTETATVLLQKADGLTGHALDSPQLLLAVTAENGPQLGQSRIQIRPEIQHGAVRQKFISSDIAVRIQSGRDRWELSELNLTWIAQPGSTLVIAPVIQASESEPTFGLGRQMLRDADHLVDDQHIVAFLQVEKR